MAVIVLCIVSLLFIVHAARPRRPIERRFAQPVFRHANRGVAATRLRLPLRIAGVRF
jgi:transposase